MADHFIGINRGKEGTKPSDFVTGTSTGATDVEVRIADAAGWTNFELRRALQTIISKLDEAPNVTGLDFPIL